MSRVLRLASIGRVTRLQVHKRIVVHGRVSGPGAARHNADMTLSDGIRASPRNPIWVMSAFLGLAEITAGLAASATEGWIRGLFAVFAVAMPTVVLGLFFRILMTRPHVLYAPGDFSEATPVEEFVRAMALHHSQKVAYETLVAESARTAIAEAVESPHGPDDNGRAEEAIVFLHETIRKGVVTIDLTQFGKSAIDYVASDRSTVGRLLDYVYFAIVDQVDAYRYREQWVLRDVESGRFINGLDDPKDGSDRRRAADPRLLSEAQIYAGSELEAVVLNRRDHPSSV